jgi:hypothetical protein
MWTFRAIVNTFYIFINKLTILYVNICIEKRNIFVDAHGHSAAAAFAHEHDSFAAFAIIFYHGHDAFIAFIDATATFAHGHDAHTELVVASTRVQLRVPHAF